MDSSKSNKSLTEQKEKGISESQGNLRPAMLKNYTHTWILENRHRAIKTANINKSVPVMVKVSHSSIGESTKHLLVSFICTSKIFKFTTWAELIYFTCDWSPITDIADQYTAQFSTKIPVWIRLLTLYITCISIGVHGI